MKNSTPSTQSKMIDKLVREQVREKLKAAGADEQRRKLRDQAEREAKERNLARGPVGTEFIDTVSWREAPTDAAKHALESFGAAWENLTIVAGAWDARGDGEVKFQPGIWSVFGTPVTATIPPEGVSVPTKSLLCPCPTCAGSGSIFKNELVELAKKSVAVVSGNANGVR